MNAVAPIVPVLNRASPWVDAFFSEADASYLSPGMTLPEQVGGGQTFSCITESIRGGRVGQSVAIAPPSRCANR